MSFTRIIFTFILISIFFSCKQSTDPLEKKGNTKNHTNTDSLRLDKILNDALDFSIKNIDKGTFQNEYEVIFDNEYDIKVEISLGYHFTKEYPHLVIRRVGLGSCYIDIFLVNDSKFEKVVSHEKALMTYVNDTIQDINGDEINDFVVNWYGSSGCCLKAFSNIYLLRPDKNTFSKDFEFINPTFSPNEHIIRGVGYGQPEDTELYKYQWNGEAVDTLEYISFERNEKGETGKVLVTNQRPYGDSFKVLKRLKSVPKEYHEINGFDWFMGIYKFNSNF
jgi:hypothetical protein